MPSRKRPAAKKRVTGTITDYLHPAMCRAEYEIAEDGLFIGHIPGLDGVWAYEKTLEDCRDELQSVLEGWILLSLVNDFDIPEVDGFGLHADKIPSSATE